jgi:hypothetical protein
MRAVLRYIAETFDFNVLILFYISSAFLLYFDVKELKEKELKKEYKFSKFFGYLFIISGTALYIAARLIRL